MDGEKEWMESMSEWMECDGSGIVGVRWSR